MGANISEKPTRRNFDREFKISALKLVLESWKSVKSIAAELEISDNTLFNWKKKFMEEAKNACQGKGQRKPEQEELRKIDRKMSRLKIVMITQLKNFLLVH